MIDDRALAPLTAEHSRDFLEILNDRYHKRLPLLASQIPVDQWRQLMPDPTIAGAALDRFVHNAHRINLPGKSVRKSKRTLMTKAMQLRPTSLASITRISGLAGKLLMTARMRGK